MAYKIKRKVMDEYIPLNDSYEKEMDKKYSEEKIARDSKFYEWVSATLLNDEYSSDSEMKNYFKKEGKMSDKEAEFYVNQRNKALEDFESFRLKEY
jgi:hypothetical protein